MMKLNNVICFGALVISFSISFMTQSADINITANLIQNPPCDIAGSDGPDQPIKVPFGEVGITKINGVNYQQDFALTLSCGTGLGNEVVLYLEYRGMKTSFDDKALQASQPNLGIRLYHEGVVIAPNTGTKITMSDNGTTTLPLYAVPVKNSIPSAILYEDDFTATASVEMNYP